MHVVVLCCMTHNGVHDVTQAVHLQLSKYRAVDSLETALNVTNSMYSAMCTGSIPLRVRASSPEHLQKTPQDP